MHEERRDGRVDAAREAQHDAAVAHLFADPRHALLDERRHRPVAVATAHREREVAENLVTLLGVHDFGMEQQAVECPIAALDRGHGRVGRRRDDLESGRRRRDEVAVAGPDLERRLHGVEQRRAVDDVDHGVPELTLRRALHLPAEGVRHELHAVADAQRRRAELQHAGIGLRRARVRHAFRPA